MHSRNLWQRGETIIQRFVGAGSGNLGAYPHVVVEDTAERTILYQPEGTEILRWNMTEQVDRPPMNHRMDALRFVYPHQPYYITLWFDTGTGVPPWYQPHFGGDFPGRFRGWKVDMAAPHRRTPIGFDTTDDVLDLIVRPDRTWYTKDEDDLTGFTAAGVYTEAEAQRIRRVCLSSKPERRPSTMNGPTGSHHPTLPWATSHRSGTCTPAPISTSRRSTTNGASPDGPTTPIARRAPSPCGPGANKDESRPAPTAQALDPASRSGYPTALARYNRARNAYAHHAVL